MSSCDRTLAGVPRSNKSCAKIIVVQEGIRQKYQSCGYGQKKKCSQTFTGRQNNKSGVVNIITCWSKNKHCKSKEDLILIDDRLSLREA